MQGSGAAACGNAKTGRLRRVDGRGTALNNLAGTAEAFATSGRSYFASGPEYAALLEQMRRDLSEVAGNPGGGGGSAANGNESNNALLMRLAESQTRQASLEIKMDRLTPSGEKLTVVEFRER